MSKNFKNNVKNAVKNVANNSGRFQAAMINGNQLNDKNLIANVNKTNAIVNINAEVANCEVTESSTSHFKLSISLPWGGEAKLEWNGSTQVASSVLAKQECAKIAREEQEKAFDDFKNGIEYLIGRSVSFFQNEVPQIREAVKAMEPEEEEIPEPTIEEKVKEGYYHLDYNWRHEFERYVRNQEMNLDPENDKHLIQEDDRFAAEQVGLAKVGALNEIQLHLLDKAGILHKDTDPSNPDPIDEQNTEDEYGFSEVK